jgi:outer membrane protein
MQTTLRSGAIKLCFVFSLTFPAIALANEPAPAATQAVTATPATASSPAPHITPPEAPATTATQATPAVQPTAPVKPALRFGYVDMTRFGSDSVPGKAISARLKEKSGKFKTSIVSRQKQLEKQKKEIEAKIAQLSPAQREAKAKEFQKKVEGFQKYVQGAEKEMLELEKQLTIKLFQAVETAAAAHGKESGLIAIAAKHELLYLDSGIEAVDVTSTIIERINKQDLKL